MPTITRATHWRHAGRVPFAVWQKRINDAGGLSRVATYEVWNEAGDDSALMLEFLREESSYASDFAAIPASSNNPWNLQIAGVGLKFSSIVECVRAWRERLYSPIYKSGVYLRTQTISELIRVYAPASDGNDTEGYIRGVVDGMNRNGFDPPVTTPSTDPEPIPGEGAPMAQPIDLIKDYLVEAPVTKQYPGQGYSVGSRNIVGLVEHETQGVMTGPDRQRFFSCPGGERCADALVDFGIAQNGKIYRFQDPFTTNRIPYASGGSASAITQVARKATAQMGNPAGGVNAIYAAVEIEKNRGAAMNPAQIEATARLLAYICAMNEYPADDWKYPEVLRNNVPTSTNHSDLYTSTNCRINDDDRARFEVRCTELLRAYYANVIPDSDDEEPTTPPPPSEIIPGVDLAIAKRLFGSVKGEDGRTYSYDPNGSVSTLWRNRGVSTGMWPRLEEVWSYDSGNRRYFLFEDGMVILATKGSDPQWLKQEAA